MIVVEFGKLDLSEWTKAQDEGLDLCFEFR